MVKVVNAIGTSDKICPSQYKSWLDFWECRKGEKATYCRHCNKNSNDLVGGHVNIATQDFDGKWYRTSDCYITPICAKCNNPENNYIFDVKSEDLVKTY